jgi:hypothetical protein
LPLELRLIGIEVGFGEVREAMGFGHDVVGVEQPSETPERLLTSHETHDSTLALLPQTQN